MTGTEQAEYRRLLIGKETELAGGLSKRDRIVVERSADVIDDILLAEDRDNAILHIDRESSLLRQVREALLRLNDGTFGTCLRCEEEISRKRLAVVPWAAHCRPCQEIIEADGQYAAVESMRRRPESDLESPESERPLSDAA